MTNGAILTSQSSTSQMYETMYHHNLHMLCISHNSFYTLEHVLLQSIFDSK